MRTEWGSRGASVEHVSHEERLGEAIGGYPSAATVYSQAGWSGVLPLPEGQKYPPPAGFTGRDAPMPSLSEVLEWCSSVPEQANLALRLPHGVIGIDVDAYGAKEGGRTLNAAEDRWGALPTTFRSSARSSDVVSGIRLFRAPGDVLLRGGVSFHDLGLGDIEVIQAHHRYVVAWPSMHPACGERYRWYMPDGSLMPEGQVPRVEELPELPQRWVEALGRDALREEVFDGSALNRMPALREHIDEDRYRQLLEMDGSGEPDKQVAKRLDRALEDLLDPSGSRYDATRDHVAALTRMHAAGHSGVPMALTRLRRTYVLEVADTRPEDVADAEFKRFTQGAAALISASGVCVDSPADDPGSDRTPASDWKFTDGASFILDMPDEVPAMWGAHQRVLWAQGESLMIAGGMGLGKTTLAGQLIKAQLCGLGDLPNTIFDLPVARVRGKILYLAMDRPQQIARSFHRQFAGAFRSILNDHVVFWSGPPPADLATHPQVLTELAEQAGAEVVYLDSVKDAAIGLSEDSVGAGYNRARQLLLASGRQLCELHHVIKKTSKAPSAADVYGSAWLANGTGSIIMLTGQPGDPLIGFRHIRQPAEELGPYTLAHDPAAGILEIQHDVDLAKVARDSGAGGVTARAAACRMYSIKNPTKADVEKARRKLQKLTEEGLLRQAEGARGGSGGGSAATWFPT